MLRAIQKASAMWQDPSNASRGDLKVLMGVNIGGFEKLEGATGLLKGLVLVSGNGDA